MQMGAASFLWFNLQLQSKREHSFVCLCHRNKSASINQWLRREANGENSAHFCSLEKNIRYGWHFNCSDAVLIVALKVIDWIRIHQDSIYSTSIHSPFIIYNFQLPTTDTQRQSFQIKSNIFLFTNICLSRLFGNQKSIIVKEIRNTDSNWGVAIGFVIYVSKTQDNFEENGPNYFFLSHSIN